MTEQQVLTIPEVFAKRLQEIRQNRGWSQQQLAERMNELGFINMDRSTILKIEQAARPEKRSRTGRGITPRKVSLEEAVGFAVALGVSPLELLLSPALGALVQVAPRVVLWNSLVLGWLTGIVPLRREDVDEYERFQHTTRQIEVLWAQGSLDHIEDTLDPDPDDDRPWAAERERLLATKANRETLRAYIERQQKILERLQMSYERLAKKESRTKEANEEWEILRDVRAARQRSLARMKDAIGEYEQRNATKGRKKR
jgi:transcriptional regulator with XRE-family HTH domain